MPTKTHKTGDHTWHDEVGELDEDLPEGPGYSEDKKGCFGQSATLIVLCLVLIIV